jgi:Bacterial Ig-like domain
MSGTRGRRGRIVAIGAGLALALLLAGAGEARAGKYAVAQCGWHLGAEAAWADTTGGAKFRPSSYCAAPSGADPFDGVHLKSFTREGEQTVSGTRFARWRWTTPPGTGIVNVRGTWWHALHDGFEHRLGTDSGDGGFAPFAWAAATDVALRDFAAGFSPPQWAFEDRLLCARAESKSCTLAGSWSGLRALTITIEDGGAPGGSIGGDLTSTAWQRGARGIQVWGSDIGGGIRFSETYVDGSRVALHEYPCAKAMIGGEWRGTRMLPCDTAVAVAQTVATTAISDGPHALGHCLTDFAGNVGCVPQRTIYIDNNPPAHPRSLVLAGGDGWRRVNDFDVRWANPEQAPASPIAGAFWRITGRAGYDTGVNFAAGRGIAAVPDRSLPAAGTYTFQVWLRDEAGNDAPATAVEVPLRFDDVPPGVAFSTESGSGFPETVGADLYDEHSGPAGGELRYRRLEADSWTDLSARFVPGEGAPRARLVARLPDSLAPGTYVFRAEAADGAGNSASTTRRADGTEMTLRKPPPPPVRPAGEKADKEKQPAKAAVVRGKTRLFACLRWHARRGTSVTVPYGARTILSGRLVDADGAGLSGRRVRVVARPSRGALAPTVIQTVRTGEHGGFRLELPAGPSRRLTVVFRGEERLDRARRAPLSLRVRGGLVFHAAPVSLSTGEAVRLWGRVRTLAAPLPRRGKLVAIQYLETATGLWRPVLVTRSDHSGHFRARYRFRYIAGSARIRLRAVALSEERWPYAPGASRPLAVRVSG